jgi:cytochrome d ubiquinol oxidase subunit II
MLIGRAVSIEFRSKFEGKTWRSTWDTVFNMSSYLIGLLLGVSLGNIVSGVPVAADKEFAGTFFGLLHPYAVFLGITAVLALRMHGRFYAASKVDGDLHERLAANISKPVILFIVFYAGLTVWTIAAYPHMINGFIEHPVWFISPLLVVVSFVYIFISIGREQYFRAFLGSSAIIVFSIVNVGVGIFPNLVISAPNPEHSLTIFNASSSIQTLGNMMIIAAIGVPLVLIYTFVINKTFRGKVELDSNSY